MNAMKAIMTGWMRGLLAAGVAVWTATSEARADTAMVDGVEWTYSLSENGAILEGADPAEGSLSVPSTLGGQPVTSIGESAFGWCSRLMSVTIPDNVMRIDRLSFSGCNGLTNVTIGNSVTNIGWNAFNGCSSLTGLTIPDSVESIGEGAFSACSGLTNVTIGYSVSIIGDSAFFGCSNLASVTIPDSVTSMGTNVFSGCASALYDMNTIPGVCLVDGWAIGNSGTLNGALDLTSVRGIANRAFSGCSGLTSVAFGCNLRCIGEEAFLNCYALTNVTMPDGVRVIGDGAFYQCDGLTDVTIPDSVTSIGWGAFSYCSRLTNVSLGGGVTSIGNNAFENCTGLTSVMIPDSVTSIGNSAFLRCRGLTNVTIGNSVTTIGDYAFSLCTNLTSVSIGSNVMRIGNRAFSACSGLTAVYIHDLASWCEMEVRSNEDNPLYWAGHLYLDGKEVAGDLVIPDGVRSIGSYAFYCCNGLTSVTIPESVTFIERDAFSGCDGLTAVHIHNLAAWCGIDFRDNLLDYTCHLYLDGKKIVGDLVIPNGVTSIGDYAFYGCAVTSVMLPNGVTNIGNSAFFGCNDLTNMVFPNSVTRIGNNAFCACHKLTSVTIPDSVTSIGYSVFVGCSGLMTLYVPESWKTKYVDGEFWSSYARVPEECEIIYYEPPKTSTGVPYAWLKEHGLGDGTEEGYEAAAATNAANGLNKVWECYVAGLDPTDLAATFTAEIVFTNGSPVVFWKPDLNEKETKSERSYEVEGRPTMTNTWGPTNAASRFFRVKVALP